MDDKKDSPYGYIYRAKNHINRKNYIGKTDTSSWKENQIPIEERWNIEVNKAHGRKRRGEILRHIENAIIKYGEENFGLVELDKAYSKEDLNEKERYWIAEYDSMNPEKGYNMTEGGEGGRPTPEVIKKMTKINQEIARNPKTLEKMSESISAKWKEQNYQENVSQGVTEKWQETAYRMRQFKSRSDGKREIKDKRGFLKNILEMKKKDLNEKHDMDGKCINRRIKEMLGHKGINNFSQAKKYLENKNLDDVLKDINKNLENQTKKFIGKKEISNKQQFLKDIQNMQLREISQKYNINRSIVNRRILETLGVEGIKNYTELKKYLEGKNIDNVVKNINERLGDQLQKYEQGTIISNKREFLEDIQKLQKNEIDYKYGMDAKTVNYKIEDMLGEYGVKNYTQAKEYLSDKNLDDVIKDIEKSEK
ncbi:MAG: GIY-YIG nuclease family protein [Promethearchaeota archaeon]